ncbi:MAG: hypothetical protein OEV28_05530 [Nitrospirota bacterium]|nr:hypothetical protein [Nitrospirota bacterium]
MIRESTRWLRAAAVLPFALGGLMGMAEAAGLFCLPWEVKDWDKAKEAFHRAVDAGAAEKTPYYYETVHLYLDFATLECDENDTKGASDAVKMAITRAREAGWFPAGE